MTAPDEPFVTITNQAIYDKLVNLETLVTAMTPHAHTLRDHEKRIRSVERWKYALAPSTIAAVSSLILALIPNHH